MAPDWQQGLALDAVVVSAVDVPRQPEVRDLDHHVLAHQAVARGEVAVDILRMSRFSKLLKYFCG